MFTREIGAVKDQQDRFNELWSTAEPIDSRDITFGQKPKPGAKKALKQKSFPSAEQEL